MKPISVHVRDKDYAEFKALAAMTGKPVAGLIREAMERYLESNKARPSLLDIQPHASGELLLKWTRADLYDEMLDS